MFEFCNTSFWCLLILIVTVVFLVKTIWKKEVFHTVNKPGPVGWPFIGNALQVTPSKMAEVTSKWADVYGSIFSFKIFGYTIYSLNSPNLIRKAFHEEPFCRVLNDSATSFIGDFLMNKNKDLVLAHYGEVHKKLRMTFHKGLNLYGDGVYRFEVIVNCEVERLASKLGALQGRDVNVGDLLKISLSNTMSILLSGDPHEEHEKSNDDMFWKVITAWEGLADPASDAILRTFPWLRLTPTFWGNKYRRSLETMQNVRKQYLSKAKATYRPGITRGLIDAYIALQSQAKTSGEFVITDEHIECTIFDIILAGILTSYIALSSYMLILLHHPDIQDRLHLELENVTVDGGMAHVFNRHRYPYTMATIYELFRYITPVPFAVPHVCQEPITFEGFQIQKDSLILPNLWHVHHDSRVWVNPFEYEPVRFLDDSGALHPPEHDSMKSSIPFGLGKRQCPGETFAKSRIFLYIAALVKKFKFLPPKDEILPSCDPRTFKIGAVITIPEYKCRIVRR